jgi:hypothetical protein
MKRLMMTTAALALLMTTAHAQYEPQFQPRLHMVAAYVAMCKQHSPSYREMTVAVNAAFNESSVTSYTSLGIEAARAKRIVQDLGCDDVELQTALENLVNHYRAPGSPKFKEHN